MQYVATFVLKSGELVKEHGPFCVSFKYDLLNSKSMIFHSIIIMILIKIAPDTRGFIEFKEQQYLEFLRISSIQHRPYNGVLC